MGNPHRTYLVESGLEKRVISMDLNQLSKVNQAIGVAGVSRKNCGHPGSIKRSLD